MTYAAPWTDQAAVALPVARRHRGRMAQLNGLAAEDSVLRHYQGRGYRLLRQRYRGRAGELDLVLTGGDGPAGGLIFVEVKQGPDFDRAAARLRPAQMRRIEGAALEFCAATGQDAFVDMRIDVALVNDQGQVRVLENAFAYA